MKRKNIREFNPLRRVLEHIYTYGFFTREDFVREGLVGSAGFYDDVIRQLRDLYFLDDTPEQETPVAAVSAGKYRRYYFRRDYFSGQSRQLEAVFGLHSVRESEIFTILYCLSLAHRETVVNQKPPFRRERFVTVSQAAKAMTDGGAAKQSSDENGDAFSADCTATVSRRLKNLREAGYLRADGKKNRVADPCAISGLSDDELTQLYTLASFCAGSAYPRVAVTFLRDALRRHMMFRGLSVPPEQFLFRDSASGNMLDEEIVRQLSDCRSRSRMADIRCHEADMRIAPVFLRVDTRNGRWYLIALKDGKPMMTRVSRIDRVQMAEESFDASAAETAAREAFRLSCISGNIGRRITVEAELLFENKAIRAQFERELLFGAIEQRDGKEYYRAVVSDISELRPFLRSYGPWLKILPGEGHRLDQELREEYERMLHAYGPVQ